VIADGISRLRTDPDFAARVFVRARSRVLASLASIGDSVTEATDRVEHDVELGRAPLSDLELATAVRDLTIDGMSATSTDLDLSRALIWLHGPKDAVTRGFVALGRTPVRIAFDPASEAVDQNDEITVESATHPYRDTMPRELADPLTRPSSPFHFVYAIAVGGSHATLEHIAHFMRSSDSYTGVNVATELGYRVHGRTRFGLQLDAAALAGAPSTMTMVDVAPFVDVPLSDPFWAGAFAGLHAEYDSEGRIGAVVGAKLGLDLIPLKRHWLSIFGQYAYVLESSADHGEMTFGLAYGH
jgi:hypothetical protein